MLAREEHTRQNHLSADAEHHEPGVVVRPKRRSRFPHPTTVLGYTVAVVMGVVGVLILAGLMFQDGVPEKFRIMFGIVITLMGIYRFVLTRSRSMQRHREEREEE